MNIRKTIDFFKYGIWKDFSRKPRHTRFAVATLRMLILAIERFTTKRIIDSAAALTYSTLLAIVPILAVVFAIARGFGFNKYIEEWFRGVLSSQPQAADTIVGFVNSYLIHTQSGIILGIGLVFMLWTVTILIRNIELAFNRIWQVKKPRSFFRTVTDYMGMFILAPIIIVVTSGISIFVVSFANETEGFELLAPMVRRLWDLTPYVLMSAVFIALYVFMPNTKVKLRCAIGPGILAGVAMQGLQLFYIHSQIWVSSYNAIYGSFAALPLFMLWVQISWLICLFGAELCYANQNMDDYAFKAKTEDLSHRYKTLLCLVISSRICHRFSEGGKPYSALKLKLDTGIPIRIVNDLLYELVQIGILTEIPGGDKDGESLYQPAECLSRLSVGTLIDRLEAHGKWSLTIDVKRLSSEAWKNIIAERNAYLNSQREVLLKDL